MDDQVNNDQPFLVPFEGDLASTFVGRKRELDKLAQAFFIDNLKVAAITGTVGIGKTALIIMFARQFRNKFPGGVFTYNVIPVGQTVKEALLITPDTDQLSLLIIEELGNLGDFVVESTLEEIIAKRPSARIIFTSQKPIISTPIVALVLELSKFSKEEMTELIEKRLQRKIPYSTVARLYKLLQGHPLATAIISGTVRDNLIKLSQIYEYLRPFVRSGIISPDGSPIEVDSEPYKQIVTDVMEVSEELLHRLSENPSLVYELSPRKFEEVVTELLSRQGYEITITPLTRDGGKDIYASQKTALGSFLYIVECKRYAPDNPVGVGLLRKLYGVVEAEKATAGILATTSFFTKPAKEFQKQIEFRVSLQDYLGIQKWLKTI